MYDSFPYSSPTRYPAPNILVSFGSALFTLQFIDPLNQSYCFRVENQRLGILVSLKQMPEMDGFEATMQIRKEKEPSNVHIPIIPLTGHAPGEERKKRIEARMTTI